MFEYKTIEDSQPEERNTGGWRRAWAKILGPVAAVAALTGCVQEVIPPAPSAIETQASSPDGSLSPTEEIEKSEIEKKFEMAPVIEGLNKEIQKKDGIEKVVYLYEAGNPYGGEEGEYAGEFKKEVNETDPETGEVKEVGGVVLNPDVVLCKLDKMYETLDSMYTAERRPLYINAMMVPLDISTMLESVVQVSYVETNMKGHNTGIVIVNFTEGSLSVVCPGKGLNDYNVLEEPDSDWLRLRNKIPNDFGRNEIGSRDYDTYVEIQTKYIDLIGDFILSENDDVIESVSFGQIMVQAESCLKFGFFRSVHSDYVADNMVREGECLVFMRAGD